MLSQAWRILASKCLFSFVQSSDFTDVIKAAKKPSVPNAGCYDLSTADRSRQCKA
jgi:hypothetical protein